MSLTEKNAGLKQIDKCVHNLLGQNRAVRFLNRKEDSNKVKEYRERLQAAIERFKACQSSIMKRVTTVANNNYMKICAHLNLSDAVALLLKQQAEIQAKLGIASFREDQAPVILAKTDEENQAQAATERREDEDEERIQREIEEKQELANESVAKIQKMEAEKEESSKTDDGLQRLQEHSDKHDQDSARLQVELEDLSKNHSNPLLAHLLKQQQDIQALSKSIALLLSPQYQRKPENLVMDPCPEDESDIMHSHQASHSQPKNHRQDVLQIQEPEEEKHETATNTKQARHSRSKRPDHEIQQLKDENKKLKQDLAELRSELNKLWNNQRKGEASMVEISRSASPRLPECTEWAETTSFTIGIDRMSDSSGDEESEISNFSFTEEYTDVEERERL